jgi:hypothetical protein
MSKRVLTMLPVVAAASVIPIVAFAVSPAVVTGDGGTVAEGGRSERLDELIWDQWTPLGEHTAVGSMWLDPIQDIKTADNFQAGPAYNGCVLTEWETYIVYWMGTIYTNYGAWVCIYEDGGTEPATTEPYEFGSNPGWHEDLAEGNGSLNYNGIEGNVLADYWTYANVDEEFAGYFLGYYLLYYLGARMEAAESGGLVWPVDDEIYWFAFQRYDEEFGLRTYGGPPDVNDTLPPYWVQQGVTGPYWVYADYPYGMPLRLYGVPGDAEDPYVTDTYPRDEDHPSGVPVDTWAGCHWQDGDPGENLGIDVGESYLVLYDGDLDVVAGILIVDDADLFDVAVDFEPDDLLTGGETYTVETACYDLVGNSDTETWQFTTGYVNIRPESLGGIKARFAE